MRTVSGVSVLGLPSRRRSRRFNQPLYMSAVGLVTLLWLIPAIWTVSLSFRP
ncbi:MAG: hypothetical protein JOZ41_04395, partial [Chloroflexi bacterium]|nr:hypothetical protein [Chloroflexota bacterium]